MCGICGFVRFDKKVQGRDIRTIEEMSRVLVHRGPDDQATLLFDNIAMGFCRLSIIGLDNGMQPVFNEDETVVAICNGEIFNFIELKKQLKDRGHVFRTASDVEVIVHMYEEEGMGFLNALSGQFAFVLYDKRKRELFCARDQMGIVPLFYAMMDHLFIFGSEIKAILRHPELQSGLDRVGLDQVLTFAGLISPRTMFANVHSLENGHFLRIDDNGVVTNREYWDLIYPEGEPEMNGRSEDYYADRLEELFANSVRLRLRADVPSGIYLSGGLDSSMIAMKVSQLQPGSQREAFSIDFIDSMYSEAQYQQLIARESHAVLNQKTFFYDDISRRLRQSIYHSECPIKETYNTASLSLSETVREKGLKVVLSGEGGDELFAGYVGYRFDKMRAEGLLNGDVDLEEARLRNELWGDSNFYYERRFSDIQQMKRRLYSREMNASFREVNCLNHPVINKERLEGRCILNRRAYIDYKIRLVDHLVSDHGDRMALANSVEARYPLLDKDLAEFSATIPAELKLKGFTEKYILKKMAGRFVPRPVVEREKFHFIAPGSPYLLNKGVEYVNDVLSYELLKKQGYFDPVEIERLKTLYRQDGFTIDAPFESDLLIVVITFGILLDTFFP